MRVCRYVSSFDAPAQALLAFSDVLHLKRNVFYVFDYGDPTGFRFAMAWPERIAAIGSQNGNAYEEGLGDAWEPIQRYRGEPSPVNREAVRTDLGREGLRWQYIVGLTRTRSHRGATHSMPP